MTTQVFSFLAPSAGQIVKAPDGTTFTADSFGLITGVTVLYCPVLENAGCRNLGVGTLNDAAAWNAAGIGAPPVVAAKGATQASAPVIGSRYAFVTATASTEGATLTAVATGAVSEGYAVNKFKLYPPSNGKFDGVTSTNEAKAITANTGFRVRQRTATAYALEYT